MTLGRPPIWAAPELEASVGAGAALWARLLVHAYTPGVDPTCKNQILEEYEGAWKPWITAWSDPTMPPPDETALNGLLGRANGLAKSCLPGFSVADQVRGVDIEDLHKTAATIDKTAPGGAPPPGGGMKPATKALLAVAGGGLLVLGGLTWIYGRAMRH